MKMNGVHYLNRNCVKLLRTWNWHKYYFANVMKVTERASKLNFQPTDWINLRDDGLLLCVLMICTGSLLC